jgi:hypothetical protein
MPLKLFKYLQGLPCTLKKSLDQYEYFMGHLWSTLGYKYCVLEMVLYHKIPIHMDLWKPLIWGRTFFKTMVHIAHPICLTIGCLTIGCCCLCHINFGMLNIDVMITYMEINHNCHKFILINPTKFAFEQQPIVIMGILKSCKPNKGKEKNGLI